MVDAASMVSDKSAQQQVIRDKQAEATPESSVINQPKEYLEKETTPATIRPLTSTTGKTVHRKTTPKPKKDIQNIGPEYKSERVSLEVAATEGAEKSETKTVEFSSRAE